MPAPRRAAVPQGRRVATPLDGAHAALARGEYKHVLEILSETQPQRREERVAAALMNARALLALDRPSEAATAVRRIKEARGLEETTRAAMLLGAALTRTNHRVQGEAMLDQAAQTARRAAAHLLPEIAYFRALSRWSAFATNDAEAIVEEALPAAAGFARARLLQLLGWIDVRRENWGAATRAFTAALDELDESRTIDVKGRARTLHGLAIIAAETIDLRLGRNVRRTFEKTRWDDETAVERAAIITCFSWLSLLEGDVGRAWDERQLVLMLSTDTSRHADALVDAAGIAGIVGDHFAERRYLQLASSLLLRGDQVGLDYEQRIAMLELAASVPRADVQTARQVLTLYERTAPRTTQTLAFEGDRRIEALEAYARGKVLLAESSPKPGIAELRRAFDLWSRIGYRLRVAIAGQALFSATGERQYADAALDALRNAPAAWVRSQLLGGTPSSDPIGELTPAERRVLAELCKGKRSREIAQTFGRSFNTINNQTRAIFSAFGVRSRAALVAKCARLGILGDAETVS